VQPSFLCIHHTLAGASKLRVRCFGARWGLSRICF
jgi:hypothetical protein